MNIAIVTDSLGFPRPADGLSTLESYPVRVARIIEQRYPEATVFHFGWGGATIAQLLPYVRQGMGYLGDGKFVATFLQFGIVDATPRAFLPGELEEIDRVTRVPGLFKPTVTANYAKISQLRNYPTYTSEQDFSTLLTILLESIAAQKPRGVFFIPIFPCFGEMNLQCPSFNLIQLPRFNQVIKSTLQRPNEEIMEELYDVNWEQLMLQDGFHLNKQGHKVLADAILKRVEFLIGEQ